MGYVRQRFGDSKCICVTLSTLYYMNRITLVYEQEQSLIPVCILFTLVYFLLQYMYKHPVILNYYQIMLILGS